MSSASLNYYEHLSIEDSKFRWRADLKKLKDFVERELKLTGKWSSPGGDVKLFSGKQASIKWYQGKKVLQIQGDDCEKIKQQIYEGIVGFLPLHQMNETSETEAVKSAIVVDEANEIADLHKDANEETNKESQEIMLNALKTRLDNLAIEIETDKHQILRKISDISAKRNTSQPVNNPSVGLSRLREENEDLRKENDALINRVNNLSYILADLKTKADDVEEEKASLITTVRILQSDASLANTAIPSYNDQGRRSHSDIWQTNGKNLRGSEPTKTHLNSDVETYNRYEMLSDDVEIVEQAKHRKESTAEQINGYQPQKRNSPQNNPGEDPDTSRYGQLSDPPQYHNK